MKDTIFRLFIFSNLLVSSYHSQVYRAEINSLTQSKYVNHPSLPGAGLNMTDHMVSHDFYISLAAVLQWMLIELG